MSVVLVCLPNAPKVSEEAVKRDAELDKFLESRVEGEIVCVFPPLFSQNAFLQHCHYNCFISVCL